MATTNTTAKPAAATTSRLGKVKSGIIRTPRRIFIYGAEGTGKTTLAADADKPIFIDANGGSADINLARYQFRDDDDGYVPRTHADIIGAIDDLGTADHAFKTLVLDTGGDIEKLIWKQLIDRHSDKGKDGELTSIESFGYGKGYVMSVDEWRALCVRLDRLRAVKKMNIIILAHATVKNFKNPAGPDFDRWVVDMDAKAAGFLKGWCDIVGMLAHEETTKKEGKFAKAKGISTGARVLRLAHSAAFDAKGRGNLPEEVDIPVEHPWAPLAAAIEAGYEDNTAKLAAEIADETKRIGDAELTAKVETMVKAAVAKSDLPSLITYLNSLKTRPAKSAEAQP